MDHLWQGTRASNLVLLLAFVKLRMQFEGVPDCLEQQRIYSEVSDKKPSEEKEIPQKVVLSLKGRTVQEAI